MKLNCSYTRPRVLTRRETATSYVFLFPVSCIPVSLLVCSVSYWNVFFAMRRCYAGCPKVNKTFSLSSPLPTPHAQSARCHRQGSSILASSHNSVPDPQSRLLFTCKLPIDHHFLDRMCVYLICILSHFLLLSFPAVTAILALTGSAVPCSYVGMLGERLDRDVSAYFLHATSIPTRQCPKMPQSSSS